MLADGELKLSLTFNPNEAANLIATKQLPPTAYSFGFAGGTIGNVHSVAIPVNSGAKAGAQVFTNSALAGSAGTESRHRSVGRWQRARSGQVARRGARHQCKRPRPAPLPRTCRRSANHTRQLGRGDRGRVVEALWRAVAGMTHEGVR